jgi:hypothetical protein
LAQRFAQARRHRLVGLGLHGKARWQEPPQVVLHRLKPLCRSIACAMRNSSADSAMVSG